MKLINPSVELWENTDNNMHIMRCAKVCYASDESNITPENAKKFIENKVKAGHASILRHGSVYYKIPAYIIIGLKLENIIFHNPYCNVMYCNDSKGIKHLWISTNLQFIHDNFYFLDCVEEFETDFSEFYNNKKARELCRYTFCAITQISTSRELNRVSPNAICEQSTRYVNFGSKENGITICIPHWWEYATDLDKQSAIKVWSMNEEAYVRQIANGYLPQDAREFLPLSTATKCVYTYSVKEWRNILDLRYYDTTGKPHPNAKIIASKIRDIFIDNNYRFRKL